MRELRAIGGPLLRRYWPQTVFCSTIEMNFAAQSVNLLFVIFAMLVALTTGTVIRLRSIRRGAAEVDKKRLDSLRSWWIVAGITIGVTLFGETAACVVFFCVSLLAFAEFLTLAGPPVSTRVCYVALATISAWYALLALGYTDIVFLAMPIIATSALGTTLICEQRTKGFLSAIAKTLWGLLVTTYLLGHVILLFHLPGTDALGGASWFLLLVLLTEGNDIVQALVGRRFGRRHLAPAVSPNKTWEGWLGGTLVTVVLAVLVGPLLTSLYLWEAALGGFLVSVMGLLGDLNISALKRDAGVKDSGTLLPGQGGVLDRIDSLTFTAPAFYYFAQMTMT